jgi:hypothetical protein
MVAVESPADCDEAKRRWTTGDREKAGRTEGAIRAPETAERDRRRDADMAGDRCWAGPAPNGSQRRVEVKFRVQLYKVTLEEFPESEWLAAAGLREDSVHTVVNALCVCITNNVSQCESQCKQPTAIGMVKL